MPIHGDCLITGAVSDDCCICIPIVANHSKMSNISFPIQMRISSFFIYLGRFFYAEAKDLTMIMIVEGCFTMDQAVNQLDFEAIALSWYWNDPVRARGSYAENPLFAMLYHAYCRIIGKTEAFQEIVAQGSISQVSGEMYRWYRHRYADDLQMKSGTKGQKRAAVRDSENYTFDLLYCDGRQFRNYLASGLPYSGSQERLSFVLHTAVAFLVPPAELDKVLQHLGFHPLHVKNLHHLAIFTVLSSANSQRVPDSFHPFERVKALYFRGCDILRGIAVPQAEGYHFGGQQTLQIRKSLFEEGKLTEESFDSIVAINGAGINARHSLILDDFHKLAAVFTHVFDTVQPLREIGRENEAYYSLYAFISRYCNETLSRRKFREQMTGMIDSYEKHPTRNILILLWLYAFCFSFLPGVFMEPKVFGRIVKQLNKYNPAWASEAKKYYDGQNTLFDINGFLNGGKVREASKGFVGTDFIADINEKLSIRYGWGQLNDKLPFDYYILKLKKLKISLDSSDNSGCCGAISYDGCRLAAYYTCAANVPCPLAVITELLDRQKEVAAAQSDRRSENKQNKQSPCPLKCSLYEQI